MRRRAKTKTKLLRYIKILSDFQEFFLTEHWLDLEAAWERAGYDAEEVSKFPVVRSRVCLNSTRCRYWEYRIKEALENA